jgi:hypothetical protein
MLWYKGWIETRMKLLLVLSIYAACLLSFPIFRPAPSHTFAAMTAADQLKAATRDGLASYAVLWAAIMLAGAGIATQTALHMTKGLPGSTLYTLSLPVSRLRLLATRAGLGWLVLAGFTGVLCSGLWIVLPLMRATVAPDGIARYTVALIVCSSGLYCVSVLLATFLDDTWRFSGSVVAFGSLWWLQDHTLPASANIFRAMSDGSPLVAHTMPWTAMALSLGIAVILFYVALKIVQHKEY